MSVGLCSPTYRAFARIAITFNAVILKLKMKSISNFVIIISMLLLSACTSTNIPKEYKLPENSNVGLAVGTITYTGSIGAYRILVTNESNTIKYRFEIGQVQWDPFSEGEFDKDLGMKGKPFATELPAGNYILSHWLIAQGASTTMSKEPISIPFTIEAGKPIYLGNFHFTKTSNFGLGGTKTALVTLEDKANRDLPILNKRYPSINLNPTMRSIAPDSKIENIGGGSSHRIDMSTIYIPVVK
jgi:hypothetical protein